MHICVELDWRSSSADFWDFLCSSSRCSCPMFQATLSSTSIDFSLVSTFQEITRILSSSLCILSFFPNTHQCNDLERGRAHPILPLTLWLPVVWGWSAILSYIFAWFLTSLVCVCKVQPSSLHHSWGEKPFLLFLLTRSAPPCAL